MSAGRRAALGGLTLVGLSQLLSSLSNLGASLLVARLAGLAELGEFAVALACYLAAVGVQRAVLSDPLVAAGTQEQERAAVVGSVVLGLVLALPVLAVGLVMGSSIVLLVAAGLPLLLAQDLCRYVGFRSPRPTLPVLLDGLWLTSILVLLVPTVRSGSPAVAVGAWCLGGALAGAVGIVLTRTGPAAVRTAPQLLRRLGSGLSGPLLAEGVIVQVVVVLGIPLAAASISLATAGTAKAATMLLAPVALVVTAVGIYGFSVVSRAPGAVARTAAMRYSALGAAGAFVGGLGLCLLAAPLSRLLLGADAAVAPAEVLPFAVALVAAAAASGAVSLLKRDRLGGRVLRARAAALTPAAVVLLAGVVLEERWLVFSSAAVAAVLHAVIAWVTARRVAPR